MAETKPGAKAKPETKKTKSNRPIFDATPLFNKENYKWMLVGLVLVALGLLFMMGGKSKDPNVFNPNEVYSFRRITLAPILILGGFVVEIFAIFKNTKSKDPQ